MSRSPRVSVYQLCEDRTFLVRMYLTALVLVGATWWDRHRQHARSCEATIVRQGHYHRAREHFLRWLSRYLAEHGPWSPSVWDSLQRALAPCDGGAGASG